MLIILLGAWLAGADPAAQQPAAVQRYEASQPQMGTLFGILAYATDETAAHRAFDAAFGRIEALHRRFSDYDPESELSRLGRQSPTPAPVPVSEELFEILDQSQRWSVATDGAFDVTVGPLTKLWRRYRRQKMVPPADKIREALAAVGYRHLTLDRDRRAVSLLRPGMSLDLGAIAKGYATDEALAAMRPLGVTRALVNASGNVSLGDPPPDAEGWRIDVAPLNPRGKPDRTLRLSRVSVATSGDAWQFVEVEGRRYSHILDPRTGYGVTRRTSATVIAPSGSDADALATALNVLPPDAGLKLIERTPGAAALLVVVEDDQPRAFESPHFRRFEVPRSDAPPAAPPQDRQP